MLNILSGSAKIEIERALKRNGFQLLGREQKGTVLINVDGRERLSSLEAEFTARKNGKDYIVVSSDGDPADPALRRQLVEYQQVFGLYGLLLVNPQDGNIQTIRLRFPRERGLEFYFQFLIAMFIIAFVIGIIWLLANLKLI